MRNFSHKLFGSRQSSSGNSIPANFSLYADKAIQLIAASDGQLEDEQILGLFETNGIPTTEAIELLLFLPTAFCRHMLAQIDWPNYYMEYISESRQLEICHKDNSRYIAIQNALHSFLASDFKQKDYLKIASRDSSFKALNQLLNAGGKLEDATVSPNCIVR